MTEPDARPHVSVCGIGASAGGVEALQQFFLAVAPDLGLAYVVIVHLAPDHKSELPAILSRCTTMPVVQVGDSRHEPLQPNHVYVIAPDRKLEITESAIGASRFDQPRGHRTAIDLFFRSLASTHGDGFAVLLSGSGSDGALGARAVKEHGGLILVQDPDEAMHGGMPRAAISTGAADLVLPVRELAVRLGELARGKPMLHVADSDAETAEVAAADDDRALKDVLNVLRKRTGHDFSKYKRSTVLRRLARRMQLAHQLTIEEYLTFLRASATEPQELLNDLLISVTMFFRDPDAWAALQAQVIGPLVEHAEDTQLRVWVAGCATGEEAYSVAILFCEEFDRRDLAPNFVVFASDVDEGALAVAREGLDPHAISADVSESRLAHYFRSEDDHYRVTTEVRDHIVFAAHSLLRDPPFSRVHLIACRNVLIYLDRDLQEQIMTVFRYACRDDATLFLGQSETVSDDLFHPIDKKHRLFGMRQREDGRRPALPDILSPPLTRPRHGPDLRVPASSRAAELHLSALEQAAPPSVVIDERSNVTHVSPTAARFFQQGAGALANRLTELVRPEIRDELYALLQRAMDDPAPQLSGFFSVCFDGSPRKMALLVQQRPRGEDGRRDMLVTFLDAGAATTETPAIEQEPSNDIVRSLRDKLRLAEQHVEGIQDDHSLTTEDLRAANEELQSLNEEYRSTTEELETSKEEMQSINEELHTVNQELKIKLEEVSSAHDDLANLMAATNVATLFLTSDLRIKRFTPQLGEIFKVKSRDLDRPISDLKHTLDYDLEEDARRVLATVAPLEREVRSAAGATYIVRLGPYRTARGRDVDGVVATFIDVTAIKEGEQALRESEARLASELNVMRRLHTMTLGVATAVNMQVALEHVLAAAIDLHAADSGNVQLLDPGSHSLRIVAQRGFQSAFLERFAVVDDDDQSASGRALRTRHTVQIADVATDAAFAPYRAAAAEAGYQAVQSAPLIAKDGTVAGVLSVHFRSRHVFAERDRQLGDVLGHVAADLIESRAQHDSLQTLNENLRRRTLELEASRDQLAQQALELTQQDRNREEFLATLGHELRNPLSAIQSSVAVVRVEDDRSHKALAVVERQTQHMTRLINDLLDMTRVRHGRVRLERQAMDLNQAVAAAIDTARPRADAKGLRIEFDVPRMPVIVDGDPERVAQILDNLLRNAIGYTDKGSIAVHVHKDTAVARVAVHDTGIGIERGDSAHLFEAYRRGVNNGRSEGLGLGLALVKSLVEAHGGAVAVESDGPGAGSTFSVTIPLADRPVASPTVEHIALPSKRRVLVVDDQRDVADTLALLLETLGQEVAVAYDARTAVALARERRPRVAFLDVWMPGVTGSQLAHQLRAEFAPGELTLVAVTGHDKRHPRVLDGQFDQHLLKPVTVENVVALLNDVDASPDDPSQS